MGAQPQNLSQGEGEVCARGETQSPELEGSRTSKPGKTWNSSLPSLFPCIPKSPRPRWGLLTSPGREKAKTVSCLQYVLL